MDEPVFTTRAVPKLVPDYELYSFGDGFLGMTLANDAIASQLGNFCWCIAVGLQCLVRMLSQNR